MNYVDEDNGEKMNSMNPWLLIILSLLSCVGPGCAQKVSSSPSFNPNQTSVVAQLQDQAATSTIVTDDALKQCQTQWQNWANRHAGPTPFVAYQKTSALPLDEEVLKVLLTEEVKSDAFKMQLQSISSTYKDMIGIDPNMDKVAMREKNFSYYRPNADPRDLHIVEEIKGKLDRIPENHSTLTFVYAGGKHIRDFYLTQKPPLPVMYAAYSIDDQSHIGSEGFRIVRTYSQYESQLKALRCLSNVEKTRNGILQNETNLQALREKIKNCAQEKCSEWQEAMKLAEKEMEAIKGLMHERELQCQEMVNEIEKTVEADSHEIHLLESNQNRIYSDLAAMRIFENPAPLSLNFILPQSQESLLSFPPSAILISDFHSLNSLELVQDLPAAECFQKFGIDSIHVLLEGFPSSNHTLTGEEAYKRYASEHRNYYKNMKKLLNNHPELRRIYESEEAQLYPNYIAFIKKMKSYADAGITVKYSGLEPGNKVQSEKSAEKESAVTTP